MIVYLNLYEVFVNELDIQDYDLKGKNVRERIYKDKMFTEFVNFIIL